MSAPKYCECGNRILITLHPGRNQKSRSARLGAPKTLKDHDLCGTCWNELLQQSMSLPRDRYRFGEGQVS